MKASTAPRMNPMLMIPNMAPTMATAKCFRSTANTPPMMAMKPNTANTEPKSSFSCFYLSKAWAPRTARTFWRSWLVKPDGRVTFSWL